MDRQTYFFECIVKECFNKYFVDYFKNRFNIVIHFKNIDDDVLLVCFLGDNTCCGVVSFSYVSYSGKKSLSRHFLNEPIIHAVEGDPKEIKYVNLNNINLETPLDLKPVLLDLLGLIDDYSYYEEKKYLEKLKGEEIF